MKNMGRTHGSAAQAQPIIVGTDTVYVHTDIQPVFEDGKQVENLFSYNEVQYEKDEYIRMMAEQNVSLDKQLTDTQLALVELFESIGGLM